MHSANKPAQSRATQGLWLGFLGVSIFAMTLSVTRLATGTTETPLLSPWW